MSGECKRMTVVFGIFVIFLSFCMHTFSQKRAADSEWQKLSNWMKDNSVQNYESLIKRLGVKSIFDLAVLELEKVDKNINYKLKSAVLRARDEMELEYFLDLYEVHFKFFKKMKVKENITNIKQLCTKLSENDLESKLHDLCSDLREGKIQNVESTKLKKWYNDQKGYSFIQIVYPDWYYQYLINQYYLQLGNQGNMAGGGTGQPGQTGQPAQMPGQQISPFNPFLGLFYDPFDLNKK